MNVPQRRQQRSSHMDADARLSHQQPYLIVLITVLSQDPVQGVDLLLEKIQLPKIAFDQPASRLVQARQKRFKPGLAFFAKQLLARGQQPAGKHAMDAVAQLGALLDQRAAAAAGTSTPGSAGRRTVTGTRPTTGAASWASALP